MTVARPDVSPEEIRRVAEYWEWVKRAACAHDSGEFRLDGGYALTCSQCDQPLVLITQEQLDQRVEDAVEAAVSRSKKQEDEVESKP